MKNQPPIGICSAGGRTTEVLGSDRAFWAMEQENGPTRRERMESIVISCNYAEDEHAR